jgi:hypothetical protein
VIKSLTLGKGVTPRYGRWLWPSRALPLCMMLGFGGGLEAAAQNNVICAGEY